MSFTTPLSYTAAAIFGRLQKVVAVRATNATPSEGGVLIWLHPDAGRGALPIGMPMKDALRLLRELLVIEKNLCVQG